MIYFVIYSLLVRTLPRGSFVLGVNTSSVRGRGLPLVVRRNEFGPSGATVSTSCRYVTVVYVKKRGTILTTLMRGVTPLCIRIKPVARTGGLGFLREGREWETLARLNHSASRENRKSMPLNNTYWQGLSSPIPLNTSLPLSGCTESGGVSRDNNSFRNSNVMLKKRKFGITGCRGRHPLLTHVT